MKRFGITGYRLQVTGYAVIFAMILSGCVTTRRAVKERVDQEVAGNQGILYGKVPAPTRPAKTTREYIQVDVNLDELFPKGAKPAPEKKTSEPQSYAPPAAGTEPAVSYEPTKKAEPAKVGGSRAYVVKPDQSLSTIAKEVYGDGKKWDVIYEANKAKIGNPNKIKSGMVLVIPELGAPKKAEK